MFSPEARALLARAGSYREFLRTYFRITGLSYAEVARRGGFSSRSYPRDVTEGRRRLTARALPSMLRGLRLEGELGKLLTLLYFSEHPDEHSETISIATIQARLEKSRLRAMRANRGPLRKRETPPEFANLADSELTQLAAGLTDVIAALGECKEGATLEEIQQRTGLTKTLASEKLERLTQIGVASYRGDSRRYFPNTQHLDWTGQHGSRLAQAAFRSSIDRLDQVARNHFSREDAMLLNSAISIPKRELPRLKQVLKQIILNFVDQWANTDESPDTVVQIVAGLFEGRLAPPT